jgi:hypothetical protein
VIAGRDVPIAAAVSSIAWVRLVAMMVTSWCSTDRSLRVLRMRLASLRVLPKQRAVLAHH